MRVELERLKTKAGRKWLSKRLERTVRILSGGYYWRKERAGYTDSKEQAGIYTMQDAWHASSHCGEEKEIRYEFCDGTPTQEARGAAQLMLRAM